MNNLATLSTQDDSVKMTSLDLLSVINSFREEEGKPAMRHNDFMRKIRDLVSKSIVYESCMETGYYKGKDNAIAPMIILSGKLLEDIKTEYKLKAGLHRGKLKENVALDTIEQIKNIRLERQFRVTLPCGKFFCIDGYDTINNVDYEIDEDYHRFQQDEDLEREELIKETIGCTFVRIKV